ncbi:hypothetical protein [Vibrio sp. Vb1980]|uniref:hypothetical protein n=1 Tax=Vibrio sp. Vb1980 TaxID=3074646 RepID=UPI002964427A|nr:hypothetical protein [Vibrio sp. Vb1980]MDW1973565.1 hypothetical protein [Vibrio sp. Vb1980]
MTDFTKNLIRSLKYCSISRAAKILQCEKEDIEHYLNLGTINCCIEMNGEFCHSKVIFGSNVSDNKKAELLEKACADIGTELSFADIFDTDVTSRYGSVSAHLGGIWKLSYLADAEGALLKAVTIESDVNLVKSTSWDSDTVFFWGFHLEKVNKGNLRILSSDLLELYYLLYVDITESNNLNNNSVLRDNMAVVEARPEKKDKTHGNAVNNAIKRQEILEFAIFVKHKWPEQCEDCTKWANTIDQKAGLRWKDTGSPPLANSTIIDMLRNSLRDPKD